MKKKSSRSPFFNINFHDGSSLELVINRFDLTGALDEKRGDFEHVMLRIQDNGRGEEQITGFFITNKGYDNDAVSAFLKRVLPEYMFPSSLVSVDQFPVVSEMVNRENDINKEFPAYVSSSENTSLAIIRQYLADIWKSVLQVDKVTFEDNLFDIGGSPLIAGFLTFRINICFGISMPLKWIMEVPTVSRLADRIFKAHTHVGALHMETNDMEMQKTVRIAHLKPSTALQPFFFCPPLEGLESSKSIKGALNMAPLLSDLIGFYSIHPPAFHSELLNHLRNNDDVDIKTVPWHKQAFGDIIEEAVANILTIQETGPFWLGGFCTGCVMATAIGDSLTRKGKEVKKMILLDAPLWPGQSNEENIWVEYKREDLIWFVSYDIGKDLPGMDWTSVCELVENVPDEMIWQVMLDFVLEKNALPETTTVRKLKSAFELKFFNFPIVRYYLDLINYRYPANKIDSSLLLYSASMHKKLPCGFDQHVKTNVLLGDVHIRKIPVSHLGVFLPENLINWIDAIRKYIQK